MKDTKAILLLIPLPPPISGASLAAKTIAEHLKEHHHIIVINYERGNLISGEFSFTQLINILLAGIKTFFNRRKINTVYLLISSSYLGNVRDLFFLLLLGKRLRKNTTLHLHTSGMDSHLDSVSFPIKFLNRWLTGSVKSAIVLGETFRNVFKGYISDDKINIVNNFVSNEIFFPEEKVRTKFDRFKKINILFLSNLIKEKGYDLLLDAFLSLDNHISNKAILHFAGYINSTDDEEAFLKKIKGRKNVIYHGPVAGKAKQTLFRNAHIFCLPTYYKFEAQPFSVLEAYASGCIVLTTDSGGINNIFTNNKNGFYIEKNDTASLRQKLEMLILNMDSYKHIALSNNKEASKRYTEKKFCCDVEDILLSDCTHTNAITFR